MSSAGFSAQLGQPFDMLIRGKAPRFTATRQRRPFLKRETGQVRWFANPHNLIAAVRKHDRLKQKDAPHG